MRKEKRRFLEIANGDTKASNTPEEDALFRKKLVEERMLAFISLDTGDSTVDMRAVLLSELGKEYYAQYMNQQRKDKRDARRYWLNTLISVLGVIAAIASVIVAILLGAGSH